jgi:hypothetical protein
MKTIDMFVMGSHGHLVDPDRGYIFAASQRWNSAIARELKELGIEIELVRMKSSPVFPCTREQFPIRARQAVFTEEGSDIFILTDDDMLPFTAEQVKAGIEEIEKRTEFAILSAWPDPHTMISIGLPGREAVNDDEVMETYSCGGMRFCRKVPGLVAPESYVKGYDGVFCRHLWSEHGMRVGYLKNTRAFHLGAHCTTLWKD